MEAHRDPDSLWNFWKRQDSSHFFCTIIYVYVKGEPIMTRKNDLNYYLLSDDNYEIPTDSEILSLINHNYEEDESIKNQYTLDDIKNAKKVDMVDIDDLWNLYVGIDDKGSIKKIVYYNDEELCPEF